MELAQIIDVARLRMDDRVAPYLCSDADLTLHAAEAEAEAAMRAELLYDDSSAFLTLPLAQRSSYTLDARIWRIDKAWLVLTGQTREIPLCLTGIDQLKPGLPVGPTTGRPQKAAHVGKALWLWPIPTDTVTGSLKLAVYRLPLEAMADKSDEPEIDESHHMGLVDWVLYRAYSNKDSEVYDPERAAQALDDFTRRFGERPDANTHRRHNERRRNTTRYGGF